MKSNSNPYRPQPKTPPLDMCQDFSALRTYQELSYAPIVKVGTPRGLRGFTLIIQELDFKERGDTCPYAIATLGHACGEVIGQFAWEDPNKLPQLMAWITLNALWHCEPFDEIFTSDTTH